jgi:hypothetical protein
MIPVKPRKIIETQKIFLTASEYIWIFPRLAIQKTMKRTTILLFTLGLIAATTGAQAALTHRWALNETVLTDSVPPSGILESVSGSTTAALFGTTTGVVGNPGINSGDLSYQFNGNGNGVSTALTNVLPASGDFSVFVTARFAPNYQAGARVLFSNNNTQAGRIDFGVDGNATVPNRLTFFLGGSPANLGISFTDSTTDPVLFDGGWHEVGIARSGTLFQLYVDGVAVGASGTSSLAISTGTNYLIGRRTAFSGFWNDRITEVQVFNDARSTGVAIIPEPSSLLLGLAGMGLALASRRRP